MQSRRTLVLACLNFFTIGVLAAVLGPALPDLARQTGSSLTAVGGVLSALFFGALIAEIFGGVVNDHFGPRPLLFTGLGCVVGGMAGIALSHTLVLVLLSGVLAGIGYGSLDIGTSMFVAIAYAERSVVALNLVNVFYGLGAVTGPVVASVLLNWLHSALPTIGGGAVLAGLLIPSIFLMKLPPVATHEQRAAGPGFRIYRSVTLWVLAAIFLLYVGLEVGNGGWIAVYIQRTTPLTLSVGALIASGYWLALTGGRLLVALFGGMLTSTRLLLICLVGAVGGALLQAVSTGNAPLSIIAILVLGFSFGPIFPTAFAITTMAFPKAPGQAASAVVAMGSIGGVVFPWLQGIILTRVGPQTSVVFVALLALVMLAVSRAIPASAAPSAGQVGAPSGEPA